MAVVAAAQASPGVEAVSREWESLEPGAVPAVAVAQASPGAEAVLAAVVP